MKTKKNQIKNSEKESLTTGLKLHKCSDSNHFQIFHLSKEEKELRHLDLCLEWDKKGQVGKSVIFDSCEKSRSNQKWEYFGTSIKPEGHGNLCLDTISEEEKGLTVEVCNHAQTQIFTFALKNIK